MDQRASSSTLRVRPAHEGCLSRALTSVAVHGDLLLQSKRQTALQHADVVCIVYDVTRPETFDSVASRWMPELVGLSVTVPVVLLGNKLDIRDPNDRASMAIRQRIVPLVQQYGVRVDAARIGRWC